MLLSYYQLLLVLSFCYFSYYYPCCENLDAFLNNKNLNWTAFIWNAYILLYLCNDSDCRKFNFSSGIHFTISTVYNKICFKLQYIISQNYSLYCINKCRPCWHKRRLSKTLKKNHNYSKCLTSSVYNARISKRLPKHAHF